MSSKPANAARVPFKDTMSAADRATFNRWLLGVSAVYAGLAVLIICVMALGSFGHSKSQQAAARMSSMPSTLAP
jgi:hypothetical protein